MAIAAAEPSVDGLEDDLSRLDAALVQLRAAHPRSARVLDLRFFGRKSVEETADELGVATGTVKRDFAFARSFLLARMAGPEVRPTRR